MLKIGSASIDENGKAVGGAIGDQTGREIRIQQFYDYPWTHYIEHPNKAIAEKAAYFMEEICNDNNFGYDQSQRLTGYYAIKAIGGKVLGAKGEFDCSSLVSSCYNLAGVNVSPNNSTYTMVEAFKKAGFIIYTDHEHVHTDKFATRGGIYLNETHHVVMVLEDGPDAIKIKQHSIEDKKVTVAIDNKQEEPKKHWGQAYYDKLIKVGMKLDKPDFDKTCTKAEMYAFCSKLYDLIKGVK